MSKTLDSTVFSRFSVEKDSVAFSDLGANTGTLAYRRTAPKRQKDFPGMEKGEIKHTMVNPTTGAVIGIIATTTSILATASDTERNHLKMVQIGALADTAFGDLVLDRVLPIGG